ncbi:hypothetical protein [Streptomyces sp. BBFR102]|uniref:hypothetical protein n=1 Tax=Streptomyces sp. BBFR102 TaxID=3448171 RepID=UPI003F533CEC
MAGAPHPGRPGLFTPWAAAPAAGAACVGVTAYWRGRAPGAEQGAQPPFTLGVISTAPSVPMRRHQP